MVRVAMQSEGAWGRARAWPRGALSMAESPLSWSKSRRMSEACSRLKIIDGGYCVRGVASARWTWYGETTGPARGREMREQQIRLSRVC